MNDITKELQKLKALINQKQTTAIFSNRSNESSRLALGDAELDINDMTKKFVFTRAGVKNPLSIDPKTKSIENIDYINGTSVEELTNNVQSIIELRELVSTYDGRITDLEDDCTDLNNRVVTCENINNEQESRISECELQNTTFETNIQNINSDISSIKSTNIEQNARIINLERAVGHDDLVVKNTARFGEQPETLLFNFLDHDFWYIEPRWSFGDHTRLSMLIKRLFEITTDHIIYISFDVDFNGQICTWTASYDFSEHDEMPYSVDIHCSTNTIYPTEIRFTHGAGQLTSRYEIDVFNIPKYSGTYPVVMKELRVCTQKEKKYNVEISKEGNIMVGGNLTVNGNIQGRLSQLVSGTAAKLFTADNILRWWNEELNTNDTMYFQIGKNHEINGGSFWLEYTNPGYMLFKFYPGNTLMVMHNDTQTTTVHGNLCATRCTITQDATIHGNFTTNNEITCGTLKILAAEKSFTIYYSSRTNKLYLRDDSTNALKDLWGSSQTITHITNVIGDIELGTFCEANGTIYDGYDKISNTDCICVVKQATLLNKKIVGIVINKDEFASHGDVLVKIEPGITAEIGDILCPNGRGYGRVATEDELIFMMMYAIPRPKITCLDTGIDGYVACFIV